MCTLPIHIHYSHFVRTESLGLVLCLGAILLVLHPRTRGRWWSYLNCGRDDAERKKSGSTYDPFEEERFEELAKLGGGFYELGVFEFDLRASHGP